MHTFGKGKNVASVLEYHGKMWYSFAVPHFAILNFAPAKSPPPYASQFVRGLHGQALCQPQHQAVCTGILLDSFLADLCRHFARQTPAI